MAARVLIVASDHDIGELYTAALATALDCESICVPDPASGQRIACMSRYDAVVVDIEFPVSWDDCGRFADQLSDTPVVAVSGWVASDGRFRRQAFENGCAAFILKPCTPEVLVETLTRVMRGERDVEMLDAARRHFL